MKRIMLKLSGEALAGDKKTGFDEETVRGVALQVKQLVDAGTEVGIVIGGGNFWRGRSSENIDRTKADQIGMLATIMNSLCLQETLISNGVPAIVQTAIEITPVAKQFDRRDADEALNNGKVVIFGGGTGCPFFSTDTTAALRACEIEADVILLAKNVDGIYDSDPKTNKNAKRYDEITYMDFISQGLKAMDTSAVTMCMENNVPILAFALLEKDSIVNALTGNLKSGTWIK